MIYEGLALAHPNYSDVWLCNSFVYDLVTSTDG